MTISIPLTKGFVAVIDDVDADLARHKWGAVVTKNGSAYAMRSVGPAHDRATVYLHRKVAERMGFDTSEGETDHINGDRLNCRRSNIRHVPVRINRMNVSGPGKANTSGHLGVSWNSKSKCWRAQMRRPDRPNQYIGSYNTIQEAIAARLAAEREVGIQPRRLASHGLETFE